MNRTRRAVVTGAFALALVPLGPTPEAIAETSGIISAPQAHAAALNGDMPLIDIRTPEEWAETGVAENAMTINMLSTSFISDLEAALEGDRSRPFAMICATGGRTRFMAFTLRKLGFAAPVDVSEGMMGSSAGPGWLARGLPVRTVE